MQDFRAADRLAIQDLTHRYALFCDTKQLEPLIGLFARDALFDESVLGTPPLRGTDSIRTYFKEALPSVSALMHVMSNLVVDFVDATHATGTSTLFFEGVAPNGRMQRLKGYFHDAYELAGERWRIQARTLELITPPQQL